MTIGSPLKLKLRTYGNVQQRGNMILTTDSSEQEHLSTKVMEASKDVLRTYSHSKRVGNYLIGKTLGEGSFAKVKEAMHTLTAQKVAVKIIDKRKVKSDAYVRKNLKREARLLQMVRHPNIVKLYETMETENSYYIITELCDGGELMDRICSKKRLDEREVRTFMRQILSAVFYLHSAGVLHRDLKIENLLFDLSRNIKLIDFGLSNSVKVTRTPSGGQRIDELLLTQCGSPAYAAPELLAHKKYGPSVDVWSIGVNMYAMLTGSLPFTVEPFHIKSLLNKMLKGEMNPMPVNTSKSCRDLIRKLLNPLPEQRISIKEAMEHPWIVGGACGSIDKVFHPNRVRADCLHGDVLEYMSKHLTFKLGDVIRCVISNTPSSACATYHLLERKITNHKAELRASGKVAASETRALCNKKKDSFTLTPRPVDIKMINKTERETAIVYHSSKNKCTPIEKDLKFTPDATKISPVREKEAGTTYAPSSDREREIHPVVGKTIEFRNGAPVVFRTSLKISENKVVSKTAGPYDVNRTDPEFTERNGVHKVEQCGGDGSPIKKVVIHRRKVNRTDSPVTAAVKVTNVSRSGNESKDLPRVLTKYCNLNKPCSKQELAKLAHEHVSSSEEAALEQVKTTQYKFIDKKFSTYSKRKQFRRFEPQTSANSSVSKDIETGKQVANVSTSYPTSLSKRHPSYRLHTWSSMKKTAINVSDFKFSVGPLRRDLKQSNKNLSRVSPATTD